MLNNKTFIFLLFIFTICKPVFNQDNTFWKFKTGDSLNWANPEYIDKSWQEINVDRNWENQGFTGYDGYAWYRKNLVIPSSLKEMALKYGGLLLKLGKIDDADYTYFNGEFLGKTGDIPPNYVCKWDTEREYLIQVSKINWDQPNLIAVRVYDAGGGGGIYGNGAYITLARVEDLFKITPQFEKENHIYTDVSGVNIPVKFVNSIDTDLNGTLKIKTVSDFGSIIEERATALMIKNSDSCSYSFQLKNLTPGIYKTYLSFESNIINKNTSFTIGVDPEKLVAVPDRKPDFQKYWDDARKELALVPPEFNMIKVDSLSLGLRNIYLVEMKSIGNVLIRGWYGVPKKQGKYPAVLHVQGYSTTKTPRDIINDSSFIGFALNIRGHGNSKDDVNPGFPGYILDNIEDREKYIYRGAYMDCLRAVDFLFSRPEVDTTQIVVEGGSQGGALSFATAALDNNRIKLCIPHVPFLSDFREYFKIANWPANEFIQYVETHPGVSWDSIYSTLSYFDIKNLALWIKSPVYMTIGLCDETCPPRINFAAYNNLSVPKDYFVYPYAGHSMPITYYESLTNLIKEKLKEFK